MPQIKKKQRPKRGKGIIVDIGTGDGKFTYKIAKENPDRLVIGIDPNAKGVEKYSAKIYKKVARGGLENALFVLATVEDLPEELNGIANQVFINFPWGSLLAGIVKVEDKCWDNIKRICKKGAFIDLLFGYDERYDKTEIQRLKLPTLSRNFIYEIFIPKLQDIGLEVIDTKQLTSTQLTNYPSTWAKKMGFGKERKYWYLRIKIF